MTPCASPPSSTQHPRSCPSDPHLPPPVHQSNVPSYQFRSYFPERHGGTLVGYLDSLTGAAENADLFHAAILNLASAKMMEIRVSENRRRHFGRVTGSPASARLVLAYMLQVLLMWGVTCGSNATRTSLCYDHLSLPRARMAQSI